jgi:hypothetical protein
MNALKIEQMESCLSNLSEHKIKRINDEIITPTTNRKDNKLSFKNVPLMSQTMQAFRQAYPAQIQGKSMVNQDPV